MSSVDPNHGSSSGGDGGVVFRRRESPLSTGSAVVNYRSSYEARSVFELDALSAIGAIINTPAGTHRFLRDRQARELWLDTLERGLLKRYLERILAFYPTINEATEYLGTASERNARFYDPIAPAASTDPFIELTYYATFGLLLMDPRAALVARSGMMTCRVGDLMVDSKQRALKLLVKWITQSEKTSARTELETALLNREDRSSVKQSLLHFRCIIRRELQLLRDFVTRFVLDIYEKATVAPGNNTSGTILQTHIPETFLSDSFCTPSRVKRAFVSDIEQLLVEPTSSVEGALVDVVDPSLNCRVLDCNSRRVQHLPVMTFTCDEPEVFSAYGHGGQSSSSHASRTPLLSRGTSASFQWLPSDVMVHFTGTVTVESEINCIHPAAFPAIYTGMEHLIAGFVPLFEQVLTSIATAKPPLPCLQALTSLADLQIPPLPKHFPGLPRDVVEKALQTKRNLRDTMATGIDSDEADTRGSVPTEAALQEHWKTYFLDHRLPPRPQFVRCSTSATPVESHAFPLQGHRIQVIPKVSTIRLTPENPKFDGQSGRAWQVDGDSDERLVVIGFHVLEHENISTPEISFRAFAHKPSEPSDPLITATRSRAKDEFLAFGEKIAGYHDNSYGRTFLQPWGSMALLPDRSFAIPAFLAHRLEPFELLDPSSTGKLTLVTLFLADPTQTIASAATIRPEQHDRRWMETNVDLLRNPLSPAAACLSPALLGRSRDNQQHCKTRDFPDEIAQLIADFAASDALSAEGASCQRHRELLVKERARRHEIRFLYPACMLEQLRIALPDVPSSA